MPKKVTTRYISVVFIESEDYLQTDGDDEHPVCNVDVQAILLSGSRLVIPEDILPTADRRTYSTTNQQPEQQQ